MPKQARVNPSGRKQASLALEDGLALLEESLPRLLGVLTGEGAPDIGQLVAELLLHVGGFQRFHQAPFQQAQRDRLPPAQLFAVLSEPVGELRIIHDLSRHAECNCFVAEHGAVFHHEPHGALITHGLGEGDGKAAIG